MLSCESAWHSSEPWVNRSTTANTPICCKCWCTRHVQQWYTWKPNALVWFELGPCFGGWNRLKIVDIQRLLTLPTPNLSHPTACLGRLLCGCGCKAKREVLQVLDSSCPTLGRPKQKYQEGKLAFGAFAWFGGMKTTDSSSCYESHATYLRRKIETKCTGASKISSTFRGSYSRLVLDLAVNVVQT